MTRFWVMEPADGAGPSERARLVPDRFRWAALPLPALWLALNRAWAPALVALLVDGLLVAMMRAGGLADAAFWLAVLFRLGVALEGPRLVARAFRKRGWREASVVHAATREQVDTVYYASGPIAGAVEPEASSLPVLSGTVQPWWHQKTDGDTEIRP